MVGILNFHVFVVVDSVVVFVAVSEVVSEVISVVGSVTHSGHAVVVSGNSSSPNRTLRQLSSISTLLHEA